MPMRLAVLFGALNAALAVAIGAFGAHALRERLSPELLTVYETAGRYHFFHALGLLAVGLIAQRLPDSPTLLWSTWLLLAGIVLFCGSLYALSLTGIRALGAITPVGGLCFIAGWLMLAFASRSLIR